MSDDTAADRSSGEFLMLVIDDDMIQRTIISKIGTQTGFKVISCTSFDEAVDLLTAHRFDCITLDLSLGEQSGALLLRTIIDTGNRVPVLIISGAEDHVLQTTVKIAQSLDLDSMPIKKPLNLTEIRKVMVRKRQNAGAQRGVRQMEAVHH